jgi:hypothetical protein
MKKLITILTIIVIWQLPMFSQGRTSEIKAEPVKFTLNNAQDILPPELSFFPQKISKKDILVITRKNNETDVTALHYTVTAGDVMIEGDFEGSNLTMTAYIDLVTPLKSAPNLEKINVVIKDNNNRTVTDTDINLIQLNN